MLLYVPLGPFTLHQRRSLPFQGPKKSRFQSPPLPMVDIARNIFQTDSEKRQKIGGY
jgi:hypothetical protein